MESWRNRKTLILSRSEMTGLLTPAEYNASVEQAYRMHGERRFYMDPKGHIVLDKYPGEWEAMPSYIEEPEAAACMWVSIREKNREKYDLPTVFSILIYTHPETGFPLAICDGSHHTEMRTGSAAAVSVKWMARKSSKILAIVGAAHMAAGVLAREYMLGVTTAAPESYLISKILLQFFWVHIFRAGLHRIENIHASRDQIWNEGINASAGVEENMAVGVLVNILKHFLMAGKDIFLIHASGHQRPVLHA